MLVSFCSTATPLCSQGISILLVYISWHGWWISQAAKRCMSIWSNKTSREKVWITYECATVYRQFAAKAAMEAAGVVASRFVWYFVAHAFLCPLYIYRHEIVGYLGVPWVPMIGFALGFSVFCSHNYGASCKCHHNVTDPGPYRGRDWQTCTCRHDDASECSQMRGPHVHQPTNHPNQQEQNDRPSAFHDAGLLWGRPVLSRQVQNWRTETSDIRRAGHGGSLMPPCCCSTRFSGVWANSGASSKTQMGTTFVTGYPMYRWYEGRLQRDWFRPIASS